MAIIPIGSTEIWTLAANGGWWHPGHMHLEEFQILSVNGAKPAAKYEGLRDIACLTDNMTMDVLIRFRDFKGKYVMHCHSVVHEDHAMMMRFDVV